MIDLKKSPEYISTKMEAGILISIILFFIVLCVYSLLFMRFAWMVKPRNYLLLACHISNEAVQSILLGKRIRYNIQQKNAKKLA